MVGKRRRCVKKTLAGRTPGVRAVVEPLESRELLSGYTFQTVAEFAPYQAGLLPHSNVVIDAKGNLFGTTFQGGIYGKGTAFEILAGSNQFKTLFSFNGGNGSGPVGRLVADGAGNIYGTTTGGGTHDSGTIFKLATGTGAVTSAVSFPADTLVDEGGLSVGAAGHVYGATSGGIYEFTFAGSKLTMLYSPSVPFTLPTPTVADSAGNVYFVLNPGTDVGFSRIEELPKGESTPKPLYTSPDEDSPVEELAIDGSGNLFGSMYRVDEDSTTLFSFAAGTHAYRLLAMLVMATVGPGYIQIHSLTATAGGDLYGTTAEVGGKFGVVFKLPAGSTTVKVLASFSAATGFNSDSPLNINSKGDLFGSARAGAAGANGSIFKITSGSGTVTVLSTFITNEGQGPYGKLVEDSAGNLFGVTTAGGLFGAGVVYKVPVGATQPVTLLSIPAANGPAYAPGLAMDSAGDLFGATYGQTLANPFGNVFEIPAGSSTFKVLIQFDGINGNAPKGPFTFDSAGNMFFTTQDGGADHDGNIIELPHGSSSFITLASFNGTNGAYPGGQLVVDSTGNIFGTCQSGGANNYGVIYKLKKASHAPVVLHTFLLNDIDGAEPYNGLTADAAGNLYGCTNAGGADLLGTIYQFSPASKMLKTLVYQDSGAFGNEIDGPLQIDSAGNLFGVALYHGANNNGSMFEIAGGQTVTTVAALPATGGISSPLLLSKSGTFYATQDKGGLAGAGSIYALVPQTGTTLQAESAVLAGGTVVSSANAGFTGTGYADYGGNGSTVLWKTTRTAIGSVNLVFRYANGGTTSRPVTISVNGLPIGTLSFSPTGSWTQWSTVSISTALRAGSSTIQATANTSAGGANVDSLTLNEITPVTFQGESATLAGGTVAAHANGGFTGSGYADFASTGSSATFSVNRATAGSATVTFRYANGSTGNRTMSLSVNGTVVSNPNFEATGSWKTWTIMSLIVSFQDGDNAIQLIVTGADGPNLDWLSVG